MRATRTLRWRAVVAVLVAGAGATASHAFSTASPQRQPTADPQTIVHVLNRLGYGPRPDDVDRVARMGVTAYIDAQLHPERIDDTGLSARLAAFPTLTLSSGEIMRDYFVDPAGAARPEGRQQILQELMQARAIRAVSSERQLEEVLVDFWFNHFNVFSGKGQVRAYLTAYERDAIRPHVLGSFRTMLGAVAESPAMLFYLDNVQNVNPQAVQQPQGRTRGLNENYARELMELHTLGVDGGYTQADVVAVARAFTGWGINRPDGTFQFNARLHDNAPKTVMGHTIRSGGKRDGDAVLDLLATHPSTARFIATKLARRFVADDPPQALIERVAKVFLDTRGDLRAVTRAIVTSPEFFAAECQRTKVKTPLEFVISAIRTTGHAMPPPRVVQTLRELGMPLYGAQAPTGWGDTARDWISTGALIKRMNVASTIARGNQTLALHLGSPEFQRK